jgi:hypothetical protein
MEWIEEPERKIPVLSNVELLVCGGGVAGVAIGVLDPVHIGCRKVQEGEFC